MTTQYRMSDNVKAHKITFKLLTPRDDSSDKPDERDEGFWPSKDEREMGYCPPDQYEASMKAAKERMEAWKNDEWHFVGVQAEATIQLMSEAGNVGTTYTLQSAGCWGIESDCLDYIQDVFKEECDGLLADIERFPLAVASYQGLPLKNNGNELADAFKKFLHTDTEDMTKEELMTVEYGSEYGLAFEAIAEFEGKTIKEVIEVFASDRIED